MSSIRASCALGINILNHRHLMQSRHLPGLAPDASNLKVTGSSPSDERLNYCLTAVVGAKPIFLLAFPPEHPQKSINLD